MFSYTEKRIALQMITIKTILKYYFQKEHKIFRNNDCRHLNGSSCIYLYTYIYKHGGRYMEAMSIFF